MWNRDLNIPSSEKNCEYLHCWTMFRLACSFCSVMVFWWSTWIYYLLMCLDTISVCWILQVVCSCVGIRFSHIRHLVEMCCFWFYTSFYTVSIAFWLQIHCSHTNLVAFFTMWNCLSWCAIWFGQSSNLIYVYWLNVRRHGWIRGMWFLGKSWKGSTLLSRLRHKKQTVETVHWRRSSSVTVGSFQWPNFTTSSNPILFFLRISYS